MANPDSRMTAQGWCPEGAVGLCRSSDSQLLGNRGPSTHTGGGSGYWSRSGGWHSCANADFQESGFGQGTKLCYNTKKKEENHTI